MKNKNLLGWIIFIIIIIAAIVALGCATPKGCPDPNPKNGSKMRDGHNPKRIQSGIF